MGKMEIIFRKRDTRHLFQPFPISPSSRDNPDLRRGSLYIVRTATRLSAIWSVHSKLAQTPNNRIEIHSRR